MLVAEAGLMCSEDRERVHEPKNAASPGRWRRQMKPVLWSLQKECRSLIHFEFIFVCGVRKCSSFILLQVVDQFSQHHLLKSLSFLHCIFLPPLSKIRVSSLITVC